MNRNECRAAVVVLNARRILIGCLLALTCSAAAATSTIVGMLSMPGSHASLAVDPVLRRAFVIDVTANSLKAIDVDAMQVVGSVPIDADGARARVDVAHHRVYVLHDGTPGRITTIDGKTLAVIARTPIVESPIAIATDFRRGEIYTIHNEAGHHVTIFDTKTNTVAATLQLPQYVYGMTVNRTTGKIYVPLYGSRQVAVISQVSRTVVKTIAVNMNPVGAIAEERNGSVFISGFQDLTASVVDQVAVIDSETDTVRTSMTSLVSLPNGGRFDPVLSSVYARAYVSNPDQGKVTVVDAGPSTLSKAITIPGNPVVSLVNEDDGEVYVTDRAPGANTLTILDARLERIAGTLSLGFRAAAVSRVGSRLLIFGSDSAGNTVVAAATPQAIQPDTVIATDFHHQGFDHFFHSANGDETQVLQDGIFGQDWLPTQQYWRVWKTPRIDRVPVCRLFSTTFGAKSSHFYTPYASECDSLKAGSTWQYEETSYYVVLPDANGGCSPLYEELYRLYNNGMGGAPNHAYTNSRAKRDSLQAKGWIPEGSGPQNVFACTPPLKGFVTSPP